MKSIQNVMVVIEYKQLHQPALDRALALYNYAKSRNHDADFKITAVMPVSQDNWNLPSILAVDKQEFEKNCKDKFMNWLSAFLSIHAMNVNIDKMVIYSKEVGKEIVSLAKDLCCDMLIKTADIHGIFDSVISTPLDWQMLRHSPVPVCIAKDHPFNPKGIIAVAVDLADPDYELTRLTNLRLLREAQYLAMFTGCRIVMINAITPLVPPVAVDMPGYTPDNLYDESIRESCKKALAFAARHKISPEDCHIAEGNLDDVIISKCRELNPTALFIGTSARNGLASAFIGNICERVSDSLECDLIVLTPKTVIRSVPTTIPSKTL